MEVPFYTYRRKGETREDSLLGSHEQQNATTFLHIAHIKTYELLCFCTSLSLLFCFFSYFLSSFIQLYIRVRVQKFRV